jgi:DNA polymerase-3 subunit alpha
MKTNFGHIHVHSEYSTLDGMGKLRELISTAKQLGQSFIAITDHGSMSGLWEAQKLGIELGVKVLMGEEFYYERENDHDNGHLVVIAKSDKGLENMMKLQEYAFVHNFYKKPRITWETLKEHSEGLIVTSACMGSTFAQYIINGNILEAKEWARKFKGLFGDDFYIEIQPNQIPAQLIVNQTALRIAKQLDIKVIATNDVHYVLENDAFPHEVLLALQVNKKMSDEKRWRFETNDFWLKSEDEMIETFHGISDESIIDAMNNTSKIADKCNAGFHKGNYLPKYYDVPEGQTERSILVKNTIEGLKSKNMYDKGFIKDVQDEIDCIDRNGYSGYFLIVADYVTSARKNGVIVGDGRGSGAGSKTAWLTGITMIEPHKYDLLFERFLADGREPDFDVDFSDQDAVFTDLQKKYGIPNVARIISFGTLTPKSASRKVMSCFEHEDTVISTISKLISESCQTFDEAYKASPQLLDLKKKYKVEFDVMERLQGIISHESKHAGGVIICQNLSSVLPVKTTSEDRTKRIVCFDMDMLHELGHFKFDILGLTTLPTIKNCLDSIKNTTGEDIDLHTIDLEDSKVYDMLCKGDVSGVFQIANQAQKVIEQQPKNFRDLIAIDALIRPGVGDWDEYIARRKGKQWTVHPDRLPYLKETYGLITYQEQFLLDCKTFAGWTIAYADKHVRKNKNIRADVELHNKFITDSTSNGYDKNDMEDVWDEICTSVDGGYSFNKSHAASYAVTLYDTSWLKVYYPVHFYASLMSSEKTDGDGQNAIASYIAECKQRGIKIFPPDINHSGESFVVANGGINYRITTIKDVGASAINNILDLRPIKSFDDFLMRRAKKDIKLNVLTNLIKAGCFDFDNSNRAELLWKLDMSNRTKTQIKEGYECPKYDWNDKIKAEWEKQVLGMYLSVHPMEKYGFKSLDSYSDGNSCIQGGEIYDIRTFKDKRQQDMAFVFINTLYGNIKVLIFASTWKYKRIQDSIKLGNIILVRGRRSGGDIIMDGVEVLDE